MCSNTKNGFARWPAPRPELQVVLQEHRIHDLEVDAVVVMRAVRFPVIPEWPTFHIRIAAEANIRKIPIGLVNGYSTNAPSLNSVFI